MSPYRVFLRLESMEALKRIPKAQRAGISSFIDSLAGDPFQVGDFAEEDNSSRRLEVKVIGQFAITYWADHAVSEIKVCDIRRADRP